LSSPAAVVVAVQTIMTVLVLAVVVPVDLELARGFRLQQARITQSPLVPAVLAAQQEQLAEVQAATLYSAPSPQMAVVAVQDQMLHREPQAYQVGLVAVVLVRHQVALAIRQALVRRKATMAAAQVIAHPTTALAVAVELAR
jgi:hypothetical protein